DGNGNQPHVGCQFGIDFYNFDKGDFWSTVTFQLWPPTGDRQELMTDKVFVGEDPPGGGRDLDATAPVDLTSALAPFTPSKQGYHVKLTTHTPYSNGADVKHKVLWIEPCSPPESQPAVATEEANKSGGTTVPTTTSAAVAAAGASPAPAPVAGAAGPVGATMPATVLGQA